MIWFRCRGRDYGAGPYLRPKAVAESGEGIVVILENRSDEPIEERLGQYVGDTLPKPNASGALFNCRYRLTNSETRDIGDGCYRRHEIQRNLRPILKLWNIWNTRVKRCK